MSSSKKFKIEELKENDGNYGRPLWILIDGKIYDVSNYDHPGGKDVFLQNPDSYHDLYEEFMDAGHSSSAERTMRKYYIGDLA